MKKYDFEYAKRYIQMHADKIDNAVMGMHEDWFWTAETIFENGLFTYELDVSGIKIAGINSSTWATPTLEINFKDGTKKTSPCYTGESDCGKPDWFVLGELSMLVQENRELKLPPPSVN